jgi:hypothetical protein
MDLTRLPRKPDTRVRMIHPETSGTTPTQKVGNGLVEKATHSTSPVVQETVKFWNETLTCLSIWFLEFQNGSREFRFLLPVACEVPMVRRKAFLPPSVREKLSYINRITRSKDLGR